MKKVSVIMLIPLFIFLLNFQLLLNDTDFYFAQFEENNVYKNFEISKDKVDHEASRLINFLQGSTILKESAFYTKEEILHLDDVRILIHSILILFYFISTVLIILLFYMIYKKEYTILFNSLIHGSLTTIIIIIVISLLSKYTFDSLFRTFHILAFTNNYWLLPETTSLIKLFPIEFFQNSIKKIILNSIISSLTLLTISFISKNILKKVIK